MADISADQLFGTLQPCSFRVVQFPIASIEVTLEQDHVEHKFPDRDGAHIEATGRNPLSITLKAIFNNNIRPGPTEKWQAGALFPQQYRAFLDACADRTTGILVHPDLGEIKVKLKSAKTAMTATNRGGVEVDCQFTESTEKPDDLNFAVISYSPFTTAEKAFADIDTMISGKIFTNQPLGAVAVPQFIGRSPQPPPFEPTFSDAFNAIKGTFDQISLVSRKVVGQYDHLLYRLNSLAYSFDTATNSTYWPLANAIEKAKSAIIEAKKQAGIGTRIVKYYVNPAPNTLAAICATLKQDAADMVRLNPLAAADPIVPPFQTLRYYA